MKLLWRVDTRRARLRGMEARAKLLGHPIHQMLIVLPLGLLTGAFLFDMVHVITDGARWADIAYWLIVAGLVSGVLAAIFGFVDWLAIPRHTRARRIGAWHGGGNAVVLALFAISLAQRAGDPLAPPAVAIALSSMAIVLALVTGWLGGELVDRLGIGVTAEANLNAPSSLTRRPVDPGPR